MKKKQPKTTKPKPAAVPEWVNTTPDELGYSLYMYSSDGEDIEELDVTRTEYIALKEYLAQMRGYLAAPAA